VIPFPSSSSGTSLWIPVYCKNDSAIFIFLYACVVKRFITVFRIFCRSPERLGYTRTGFTVPHAPHP
jgi:hypothetical protein